jgi:hypothetical protein
VPHDDGDATETVAEAAGEATASGSPGPCSDKAHSVGAFTWTERFEWTFKGASTPSNVNVDNAETRLKRAAVNITRSDNSCGMADAVSAKQLYLGRAPIAASVNAAGACKAADGKNAVSFGDLPAGVLGVACVRFVGAVAIEGDIKLNKADHAFTANIASSCKSRFSIEAVATHEFGHIFGLGHVSESAHGNLTMSTAINGPCQNAEATLGRGDVLALRQLY